MRTYITAEHLSPYDEWYRWNKLKFTQTQIEKYDDLYDSVLELEDAEDVSSLDERLEKLKLYKEEIQQTWTNDDDVS